MFGASILVLSQTGAWLAVGSQNYSFLIDRPKGQQVHLFLTFQDNKMYTCCIEKKSKYISTTKLSSSKKN